MSFSQAGVIGNCAIENTKNSWLFCCFSSNYNAKHLRLAAQYRRVRIKNYLVNKPSSAIVLRGVYINFKIVKISFYFAKNFFA